jgi:hypothetical protein
LFMASLLLSAIQSPYTQIDFSIAERIRRMFQSE